MIKKVNVIILLFIVLFYFSCKKDYSDKSKYTKVYIKLEQFGNKSYEGLVLKVNDKKYKLDDSGEIVHYMSKKKYHDILCEIVKSNDIWGEQPLLRKLQSKSLIMHTNVIFKPLEYGQKISFNIIEDIMLLKTKNNLKFNSIMDLELKWNTISGADFYEIEMHKSIGMNIMIYGISTNKLIFKDLSNIEILQCPSDKRRRLHISAGEYILRIDAYKFFDGIDKAIRISHYNSSNVIFVNNRIIEEYELKDMLEGTYEMKN